MRAATDGAGPPWKLALVGGVLLGFVVSIGLFFGVHGMSGSSSPRSAPHQTMAPGSASPLAAPTRSAARPAAWTPIPTDISDELPAPNDAFGFGSDFGSAFATCTEDQGFAPNGEMRSFPLAEERGGFTAFVVLESTTISGLVQVCIDGDGDRTHGAYQFDPADAESSFDAGTGLSLPGSGNSAPGLIVIELGRVLPGVAKMTFTLTDGSVVTASVDGGWAFAWWPGSATAETISQYAADGSVLNVSRPDAPTDWPPPSPLAPLPKATLPPAL